MNALEMLGLFFIAVGLVKATVAIYKMWQERRK